MGSRGSHPRICDVEDSEGEVSMSERFANRTMIVTGGSYGIGAAVTQLFLREGARVVVVARGTREPDLEFERWGPDRVRSVTGDLSEPETSADAVKSALNWGGRLDAVVNNAGMDYTGELLAAPFEDVQRVFADQRLRCDFDVTGRGKCNEDARRRGDCERHVALGRLRCSDNGRLWSFKRGRAQLDPRCCCRARAIRDPRQRCRSGIDRNTVGDCLAESAG